MTSSISLSDSHEIKIQLSCRRGEPSPGRSDQLPPRVESRYHAHARAGAGSVAPLQAQFDYSSLTAFAGQRPPREGASAGSGGCGVGYVDEEQVLWEEFERQPSVQLLRSIRRDLHTQLDSIIATVERSLTQSCGTPPPPAEAPAHAPAHAPPAAAGERVSAAGTGLMGTDALVTVAKELPAQGTEWTTAAQAEPVRPQVRPSESDSKATLARAATASGRSAPTTGHFNLKIGATAALSDKVSATEDKENIKWANGQMMVGGGGGRSTGKPGPGSSRAGAARAALAPTPVRLALREADLWC